MLEELTAEVSRLLSWCEKVGLANQVQDIDDADTIEAYVLVLVANRIEPEMLRQARPAIFGKETFFPRPADIVKHCEPIRDKVLEARKDRWFASLIETRDENGVPVMAPPERVQDGKLLPDGQTTGNGLPAISAPSLPASDRAKALLARTFGVDDGVSRNSDLARVSDVGSKSE